MPYQLLIKDMLERGVKLCPKKEIVCREDIDGNKVDFRYTYTDFYSRVRQAARMLESLGVKKGDVVATYTDNSHQILELSFAIPCMGAVFHPLTILLPKEANIYLLNNIDQSEVLVIDEKFIPLFEEIKDELKTVKKYIIITNKKELPKTTLPSAFSYEELMEKASDDYIFPELDENTPAIIVNSSGTTGFPKAMAHSHRSLYLHELNVCSGDMLGLCRDDVVFLTMPIWYANVWTLQYAAALVGAKIILASTLPDGKEVGEVIEREKATLTTGTSAHVAAWVGDWEKEGWKYDLSSIRAMMAIFSPRIPMSTFRDLFNKAGVRVFAGFGTTEMIVNGGIIPKGDKWEDIERVLRTDGFPGLITRWKVVNPQGEEVKHDGKERGLLGVKGGHVIEEYYKNPEATAKNFDKEGYFFSGDMATVDEDGFITLRERIEDLIQTKGGYVSPGELEGIIGENPAVLEVAAVGIPEGEFEKPLVCVVLKEGYKGKVSEQELRKEFEGKVAEVPEVVFLDLIPRGATGKHSRAELKKMFEKKIKVEAI